MGDESDASRVVIPVSNDVLDTELILDIIYVRSGRGMVFFVLYSPDTPFDTEVSSAALVSAVQRLRDGLRVERAKAG